MNFNNGGNMFAGGSSTFREGQVPQSPFGAGATAPTPQPPGGGFDFASLMSQFPNMGGMQRPPMAGQRPQHMGGPGPMGGGRVGQRMGGPMGGDPRAMALRAYGQRMGGAAAGMDPRAAPSPGMGEAQYGQGGHGVTMADAQASAMPNTGVSQLPGMGSAVGVPQAGAAQNYAQTPQLQGTDYDAMQRAQATGQGAGNFSNAQLNANGVGGQYYNPAAQMEAYRAANPGENQWLRDMAMQNQAR